MGQPTPLAQQPSSVASTAIAHDPDVPLLQAQIQTLYTELHSLNAQLRHTGLLDGEWNPRLQIETLMADVHALQQQLQERGYLSPEWKPPSHRSQAHTHHTNVAHD
jgi:capsule polysaccharide export protein KpsE/RkpR